MIRKSIFDTPTTPRLFVFLQWVREGNLFIPDFQRPFEWDDERRLNLLDSVSRGLPIGAFMIWRTMNDELRTYDNIGPFSLPKPRPNEVRNFLIDGHQRLTTLYAALQPLEPGDLERLRQDSGDENWPVYFDLEAEDYERGFVLAPRRRGFVPPPTWLPTSDLFVPKELWRRQRALESAGMENLAERIEILSTAFKDYFVPVLPLVTDDMKAVTDSFVRVNSGGKPMAEDKILRALAYTDYRIDEHIERLRSQLAEIGWGGLDDRVFVNALKVRLGLDVYKSSPSDLMMAIRERGDAEALRELMDEIGCGLGVAARFLCDVGVPGPAVLPYQYQIICLSEAILRVAVVSERGVNRSSILQPEDVGISTKETIRRWFWFTTYARYFAGGAGSLIRATIDGLVESIAVDAPAYLPLFTPAVEPLRMFRTSSARSIAQALWAANRDAGVSEQLRAMSSAGGVAVLERIFPEVGRSLPGNFVLTTPGELGELRSALRDPQSMSDALAERYLISSEALRELAISKSSRQAQELFCRVRTLTLEDREAEFVESLGLQFIRD